ncbi:MAG: zinc ribbon domain-containing protein [candidate division WOR-3 bacterium]
MKCPYPDCGASLDVGAKFCPICGRSVSPAGVAGGQPIVAPSKSAPAGASVSVDAQPKAKAIKLERRYKALWTIAQLYKVVAVIVLILGIVGALATFNMMQRAGSSFEMSSDGVSAMLSAAAVFVTGLIAFLLLYAVGEAICLFIDIEENTRATRKILADRE